MKRHLATTTTELRAGQMSVSVQAARPTGIKLKPSTKAAYAKDLLQFEQWGGTVPCHVHVVSDYISSLRKSVAPGTICRRVMAIRHAHVERGLPSPTRDPAIKWTLRQLQLGLVPQNRALGRSEQILTKPQLTGQAAPVTRDLLAKMLGPISTDAAGLRDRALLLLGFFAALSRAQLLALDVCDITVSAHGVTVQLAAGRKVNLPMPSGELCPATSVSRWLEALAGHDMGGPLFRRLDRARCPTSARLDPAFLSVVVKQRLRAIGVDPSQYSGQSLRRGRLLELRREVP